MKTISLKNKNPHLLGIIYILLAALFFSLMSLFVRLAGDLPTMEKAFFRNAVAAVLAVFLLARSKEGFKVLNTSWPSLFLRAACGTTGLILNFWAIDHMLLPDANILNKLSPFFAIIISIFVLKEFPSRFDWICVTLAFIGAVFIVKPTSGMASVPALAGLIGGLGAGAAYSFVRKLGKQGERGPVIVCFFSLFSTLVTLPFFIIGYKPMSLKQLLILLLAGIFAAGGQLSITAAYTHAPAKEISVFDYSQVIFAALWSIIFFGEVPDHMSFIGYTIIIGTAILKWSKTRKS